MAPQVLKLAAELAWKLVVLAQQKVELAVAAKLLL
jgi:hypothetical protein